MEISQITVNERSPNNNDLAALTAIKPQLVWVFGGIQRFTAPDLLPNLKAAFGDAQLLGCSTAGEIGKEGVSDNAVVITALHFDKTDASGFAIATTDISGMDDSAGAGERLAQQLKRPDLHNVVVLGQGVNINGSALIDGFQKVLPSNITLSGGLAADAGAFKETWTLSSQCISNTQIVAIGFNSPHIKVSHGTFHGWQPFGPSRKVTRASGNVLFELDGEPALDVYKKYLGDYAKDLPASGLLFPFSMMGQDQNATGLIRTILGIDEATGSLILAGDVYQDGYLKLMHANTDSLVDGAEQAAESAGQGQDTDQASFALLVSCIGRKLVMGARVDEEVEAVADVFGKKSVVTGFYSNGEISPLLKGGVECKLHNQTMTITHISETA